MIESNQIIPLFFALPGFISFVIIRHVALLGNKQSQVEIVFYSLVGSVISYLVAIVVVDSVEVVSSVVEVIDTVPTQLLIQLGIASIPVYGAMWIVRRVFMKGRRRYSPWYNFCSDNRGQYVIVYTKSKKRIYGWVRSGSTDLEPRREIVLGEPHSVNNKGKLSRLGETMLITESEIARILLLSYEDEKG